MPSLAQTGGSAAQLANLPLDLQRLLEILQRFLRLIEGLVGQAHDVQARGSLILIVALRRQTVRPVEVLKTFGGIAALDFYPRDFQQRIDVLRVSFEHIVESVRAPRSYALVSPRRGCSRAN